jgi:hypothetical protein
MTSPLTCYSHTQILLAVTHSIQLLVLATFSGPGNSLRLHSQTQLEVATLHEKWQILRDKQSTTKGKGTETYAESNSVKPNSDPYAESEKSSLHHHVLHVLGFISILILSSHLLLGSLSYLYLQVCQIISLWTYNFAWYERDFENIGLYHVVSRDWRKKQKYGD